MDETVELYINPKYTRGIFIPDWLLKIDIGFGSMVCYGRLARLAQKRGFAFVKRESLAAMLGVTPAQVSNYLRELIDRKLIEVEQTGRASRYMLLANEHVVITKKRMDEAGDAAKDDDPDEVEPESDFISDVKNTMRQAEIPEGRSKESLQSDIKNPINPYNQRIYTEKLDREYKEGNVRPALQQRTKIDGPKSSRSPKQPSLSKEAIAYFSEKYLSATKEHYRVAVQDAVILNGLLRQYGLDKLKHVIDAMFADKWVVDQSAFTVGMLSKQWNRFLAAGAKLPVPGRDVPEGEVWG